jgi:hypothetical protein
MKRSRRMLIRLFGASVFVGVPAWLALAQAAGGMPPANFVQDIWNTVQQAGPFASMLLLYMWLRSEAERRKLQDERDGLLERVVTALNNSTSSAREFAQLLGARRDAS